MYNAFISYSYSADDKFAPALQDALQKFAKPIWRLRALKIFRDESSLSASPHLWENIKEALDQSEYFILLASPQSENSKWVNEEVKYWIEHKSIDTILIALTDGEMLWDNQKNCFLDPDNNSLPPALDDKFENEPFYIDLRQSKTEEDLSLDNPIFKKEILKLAAKLHGKAPNDLASEEVTVHRKMIWLRNGVIGTLSFLLIVALGLGLFANEKRIDAVKQAATSKALLLANTAKDLLAKGMKREALRVAEVDYSTVLKANAHPPAPLLSSLSNSYYSDLHFNLAKINNTATVYSVAFSPDGQSILTGSFDKTAILWDLNGNQIQTFQGHTETVISVAFSPDGQTILTGSYDRTAKSWKTPEGIYEWLRSDECRIRQLTEKEKIEYGIIEDDY